MAGTKGPTRGRGHPRYYSIITTSISEEINKNRFEFLKDQIKDGKTIYIPIDKSGRFVLGSFIAYNRFATVKNWFKSQKLILSEIYELINIASEVIINKTDSFYWYDNSFDNSLNNKMELIENNIIKNKKKIYCNNNTLLDDFKSLCEYLDSRVENENLINYKRSHNFFKNATIILQTPQEYSIMDCL
eukprot:TRINITY_DN1105_c0_g1_i2.p1 TRINITY_DN1105_c0_g1~~TRINITY_DN1105_c0_g1_i2.p1  ORF type:complete len:188 (+),score=19.36 TRINITY_DN1105_c0_g1_i2:1071-1634(+)